ncbi:CotH kinase family protein [Clostridium cochlearium]|uniref:CotH kinase family protein n=2 Tax=Clostridium cochlearium TaxID=1494 RepID=A0A7Y3V778_CLOCO|nr:CotH kinase family protein [Clostridium cochlearium]NOH15960.1 CotH kinase family protein [Clostridium cochlearium]
MIKEKYITHISIISIVLCVCIIAGCLLFNPSNEKNALDISQPKYIDKLFTKDEVNEIDIIVNEKDWENLLKNAMDEDYIMGDIKINGEKFSSVGIRAKGNSSLKMVASDDTTDRYSLKIDFHEYIKNQTYYGLEKLALNNCISDATYMKEYLSYKMFKEMNIATPACSYAHIKINGQEWGLYLAVEVMEESFVERYFGSVSGNLYKPESTEAGGNPQPMTKNKDEIKNQMNKNPQENNIDNKPKPNSGKGGTNLVYNGDDLSNYYGIFDNATFNTTNKKDNQKVVEMIKNLNEGTNLEEYLDVDEILRYFAVNTFLVNLDSYAGNLKHNYYLYEQNGIFQILPWDLNLSFGGYEIRSGQSAINFPIDRPVSDTMENSPLISKLLEVEEYKEIYHKYLNTIVTKYIESGKYEADINRIHNLIAQYVKNDPTAFYTYEEYKNSLPILTQFGKDRAKSIIAQLNGEQPSTSYGTIETNVNISLLGTMGGQGGKGPQDKENIHSENKSPMKDQLTNNKNMLNPETMEKESKPENIMPNRKPRNGFEQNNIKKQTLIIIAICCLLLFMGLMFVVNFNRRKYK